MEIQPSKKESLPVQLRMMTESVGKKKNTRGIKKAINFAGKHGELKTKKRILRQKENILTVKM